MEIKPYTVTRYNVQLTPTFEFDAEELIELLYNVDDGDVVIRDRELLKVLQDLKVIEHGGSQRWMMGASLGSRGKEFLRELEDELENVKV